MTIKEKSYRDTPPFFLSKHHSPSVDLIYQVPHITCIPGNCEAHSKGCNELNTEWVPMLHRIWRPSVAERSCEENNQIDQQA